MTHTEQRVYIDDTRLCAEELTRLLRGMTVVAKLLLATHLGRWYTGDRQVAADQVA
jgi:hypothetical protein